MFGGQGRTDEDNREAIPASNANLPGTIGHDSITQAEAYCKRLALSHYENFLVASVFLPRPMRQPFYNVYAFCRTADDIADETADPVVATNELRRWQNLLASCRDGHSSEPIFVALGDTIRRFDLSIEPFDNLLRAFLRDQTETRYESFHELLAYCRWSADPVGRIVLRLAAADSPENVRWSDSICTGLQLANHWQDVGRDLQSGRVYLPLEDLRRFGLDVNDLRNHQHRDRLCELVRFQTDRAEGYLRAGMPLADSVPSWLAKEIRLFIHGGLATLEQIRRVGYDVIRKRPTVSRWQQMRLVTAAFLGRL